MRVETGKRERRRRLILAALLGLLLILGLLSVLWGRYAISLPQLFGILVSRVIPTQASWPAMAENIVWYVRLPRILLAILVGAALSVSGASYQCIFRNPMAAPDVLGASTGAAFGAALAIVQGLDGMGITLCAFLSGLLCMGLVMLCSWFSRGSPVLGLILSGIMISSLFQAGTSYIKLIADPHDTLPEITYWMMGSLSGAGVEDLTWLWIPLLLGFVPLFLLRWKINLLTMEEEQARALGISTRWLRGVVIVCATLLVAASVSVSGIIGWVGLVVPHMARKLVGSDCRILLPASFLLGGGFLLLVDDLARTLYTTELPLGILTAVIGAPFFLYLLSRKEEG
ncbi:MAG: FecCD family ABC transporter permease [Candidatus Heritagella sp.]